MSRFRKVDAGTWSDDRFMALSQDAKLLWLRFLTGPEVTSLPGLILAGRAQLAEALRWSLEQFDRAFAELARDPGEGRLPMAIADWTLRVVWLPRGHRYNAPQNPSVIRGWFELWRLIPECSLKRRAYDVLLSYVTDRGEEYAAAFAIIPEPRCPDHDALHHVPHDVPHDGGDGVQHHLSRARAHALAAPAPVTAPGLLLPGSGSRTPSRRGARKGEETSCPSTDATPEDVAAWAARWKIPTDHPEFLPFLDRNRAKGGRYVDWAAAWRQWLRKAPLFARPPSSPPSGVRRAGDVVQPGPKPGEYDWRQNIVVESLS